MQLLGVLILLGGLAWWTFQVVSIPPVLRTLFDEDEAIATAAIPSTEDEHFQRELGRLPLPPENHFPEMAVLISRLQDLQNVPGIVSAAVKRDRETSKGQIPPPWSEAELAALKTFQIRFQDAWEPFLSAPPPDWKRFPDSAIFFRSQFPLGAGPYQDLFSYAFYEPGNPPSWSLQPEDQPRFLLRIFRQCANLGTLRFGNFSGWATTDAIATTGFCEEIIKRSDYFFSPQNQSPEEMLALAPAPPAILALREGLKTDRAVFLRSVEYLQSLPIGTPAAVALTRLLGNKGDADWFIRRLDNPKSAQQLAAILREGAEQIGSLEEKTYLSGPAWRQWVTGDPDRGLSPSLQGTLQGMRDFEQKVMEYQISLAFLQAAVAYRQSGVAGMSNIPDPARPGSFLAVTSSESTITLSSAYQKERGESFSFSFQLPPAP